MDNPTHTDAFLNLFSSCFPSSCRTSPPALPPSPRLGALLREPESDDAMSLHSTYRPHTRKKKNKPAMQLCGLNLFGKPRGQIRLEDDDTEPPLPQPRPRPRYDSDAAPLPDEAIQSLGRSPTTEQPTRQESPEEELARLRAEKAARKARKRERKLKRQLALEQTGDFEGFIGSGSGGGFPISPPSTTTSTPGIEDLLSDAGSGRLRDGSDRGSARLVDVDVDPEDEAADMGAGVYTRSVRSRSESGSSATRSSVGRRPREELVPGNALGLRGPPSPLVQEWIPEGKEVRAEAQPVAETEPVVKTQPEPIVEAQPKPEPVSSPQPSITARPKPKIHISDLPLSSPGAGPGPRTLENSPRLAALEASTPTRSTPRHEDYGFPSSSSPGMPSPRLNIPRPPPGFGAGFPSSGLSRKGSFPSKGFPSPGLGKSYGSSAGLGLNSTSARVGGAVVGGSGDSVASVSGGDGSQSVLDQGRDRRGSGDAGSERSRGTGDGSWSHGDGERDGAGGYSQGGREGGSGRVTAGMGVALANRGGE